MRKSLPAVALILLGGWTPLPADNPAGGALVRVQQSRDHAWQPPGYELGHASTPAAPLAPVDSTPVTTTTSPKAPEEKIILTPITVMSAGGEEVTSLRFPTQVSGLSAAWLNSRWLDWKGIPYETEMVVATVYNCQVVGGAAGCDRVTRYAPAVKIAKSDYDAAVAAVLPYTYQDIWSNVDGGWTVLPPGDNSAFVNALRQSMGAGATGPTHRVGRYARMWCPTSNCIALAQPK